MPMQQLVRRWCSMALVGAFLGGCATQPKGALVFGAGDKPSAAVAQAVVLGHLREVLRDPDSLKQFEVLSGPSLVTWYRGLINGGGSDQGWLICYRYNAKNAYGAYVGAKTDAVVLRQYPDGYAPVTNVNWPLVDHGC